MPTRIATVNVNGIRAAVRNGISTWVSASRPNILTMQEVRAGEQEFAAALSDSSFSQLGVLHASHDEASAKGRAGVAVISDAPQIASRVAIGDAEFDSAGRWLEVDFETSRGKLTVVSCYVHSGEADTPKQVEKYRFLDAMQERMQQLMSQNQLVLITGDLNVAHTELDLKNWKGNLKSAGFLPKERAYFDTFMDKQGWVDVGRRQHPNQPGPYTWWSFRGKAFDNDAGWRIDYQLASPRLAELVIDYRVGRAASYATRWSDHAPVVVDYDFELDNSKDEK